VADVKKEHPAKYLFAAMILAGIVGVIGAIFGSVEVLRDRTLGNATPQRITAGTLLANGPGPNRHVTVTDFTVGPHAVDQGSTSRLETFLVASPTGTPPGTPGKTVIIHVTHLYANDEPLKDNLSEYTGIYTPNEHIVPAHRKILEPHYPGLNYDDMPYLEVRPYKGGDFGRPLWFGGVGIPLLIAGIVGAVALSSRTRPPLPPPVRPTKKR
jgi:hypothetical protein